MYRRSYPLPPPRAQGVAWQIPPLESLRDESSSPSLARSRVHVSRVSGAARGSPSRGGHLPAASKHSPSAGRRVLRRRRGRERPMFFEVEASKYYSWKDEYLQVPVCRRQL